MEGVKVKAERLTGKEVSADDAERHSEKFEAEGWVVPEVGGTEVSCYPPSPQNILQRAVRVG